MKLIQRYILREFVVPLCYCLIGFVSIYVLFDLFGSFSRMMEAQVTLKEAALYFAAYLAPSFHYLAPAALLLATLYTMWSMCRHSELTAMRSSGISFWAIVRPLLSVAIVMSLSVVFVSEWFVPHYAHWASQLRAEKFQREKIAQADNVVFRNTKANRTWNVDELLSSDGCSLGKVRVTIDRPAGARLKTITAARADYLDGEWWFADVDVQHYDESGREIATKTPELDALQLRCFAEFRERPSDFIAQNRPWQFNSVRDRFRYLRTHPEMTAAKRSEYLYDAWAQAMAPWACLVIVLLAIPAGISSGRQSVFAGIVGALGLFFAYHGVTIVFMIATRSGWCPAILAAVLPNVLFLSLGIRAFLKLR